MPRLSQLLKLSQAHGTDPKMMYSSGVKETNPMTCLSFTQTHQNALRELDRLTAIRDRIAGLIVDLKTNYPANYADTWITIYTDRLKLNVLPAIAEVKDYINSQELKVTKTSN